MSSYRVLIAEPDPEQQATLVRALRALGHRVTTASTADAALALCDHARFDVLVLDRVHLAHDAVRVLEAVPALAQPPEVVLLAEPDERPHTLTGLDGATMEICSAAGADVAVGRAGERGRLHRENATLRQRLEQGERQPVFAGSSVAARNLRRAVERVAASDVPVLIHGEAGTGKTLLARCIHAAAPARTGPFLTVDCRAHAEDALTALLFGGPASDPAAGPGLVAAALGGTLLLRHVERAGPHVQAALVQTLTGLETAPGAQVLAATETPPADTIAQGLLHEELYYRLNTLELHIPPLRDRPDDIPDLVHTFLAEEPGPASITSVDEGVWELLRHYDWPGNAAELRAVMARARLVCTGSVLTRAHLPILSGQSGAAHDRRAYDFHLSLDELERRHILRVLRHFGGNKTRAAESLSITAKTLYNKLRAYAAQGTEKDT